MRMASLVLAPPLVLLLAAGCAGEPAPARRAAAPPAAVASVPAAPAGPARLANRVWRVAASNTVVVGSLRAFLAESTLVMVDPHAVPAFGTWREEDGAIVFVEEGRPYRFAVLVSTPETLRVRGGGPGEPVDMTLVPAAE